MNKKTKSRAKLKKPPTGAKPQSRLLRTVYNANHVLIVPHNDPDPDAIAAAVGLKFLLAARLSLESTIAYQGIIGRAENKALVQYLNNPLRQMRPSDFATDIPIILIDTQPGSGNNPLPAGTSAAAVIDHHLSPNTPEAAFVDIRSNYGATSTIITEYLRASRMTIDPPLATALFYGIKTDTRGLARHTSKADVRAYFHLQPRVDVEALAKIETAQVPVDYFHSLDSALHSARIYDGLVIAYLDHMDYPDQAAEIADLLLRLQDSKWIVCCGIYDSALMISVRSRSRRVSAQVVVQALVADDGSAGGHGALAGGQIPIGNQDAKQVFEVVLKRAKKLLGIPERDPGQPII